ncbi:hypothetical protein IFR05_017023 [Cadophora sp. M221]|nr:hypothetical protein IFR05_017023 [Cadophora sp. M221]
MSSLQSSTIPSPTSSTGNTIYQEVGCHAELPLNTSARAIGQSGSYISLNVTSTGPLTVSSCLRGCSLLLAPNGAGKYNYVAIENSRECYCGLTL